MDGHGWVFTLYLRFCVWPLSGKNILFLPSIGQLAMPSFFSTKYMLAMVPTKEYRKNLKKTFTFTH